MRLTFKNGIYILNCTYDERTTAKENGLYWHGLPCTRPNCLPCKNELGKVWWTSDLAKATKLAQYADASAHEALSGHVKAIEQSRAHSADVNLLGPTDYQYLPYQKAGIFAALERFNSGRRGVLLADQPGLGKTPESIGVINNDPNANRVLVVCPASLKINWAREIKRWLIKKDWTVHIVDDGGVIPDANIVIVNYDRLLNRVTMSRVFRQIAKYIEDGIVSDPGDCPFTDGNGIAIPPVMDQLMARAYDYLICDEVHACKSLKTARSKNVLGTQGKRGVIAKDGLVQRANRLLFLTGTPVLNKPVELYPLLSTLDPANFGNFFSFAKRYCGAQQRQVTRSKLVWDFSGASNLESLNTLLRSGCMIRRLKEEVLTELPPKRRSIIPLEVKDAKKIVEAEAEVYNAQQDRLAELRAEADLAHAERDGSEEHEKRYQEAVDALRDESRFAFNEIARARYNTAMAKLPAVIEHLEELFAEGYGKIVVFGHHVDVIKSIYSHFGDKAVVVMGETSMKNRQAAVDRFQTDPTCMLFVGNIQAAGVGITLTASSTVVFAELDWSPSLVTQAEDRCHRVGATAENILIQHLVIDESLDAKMAKILVSKQAIADRALDSDTSINLPVEPLPPEVASEDEQLQALGPELVASSPPKHPPVSENERLAIHAALRQLATYCDGASKRDGSGFNRYDATIGHRLASKTSLTDNEAALGKRLVRKYKRQLDSVVITA